MMIIFRFCLRDLLRSRFIAGYFLFHLAAGYGLMAYAPTVSAGLGALLSLILFIAPLCSLVFGVLYFHQCRGFHELMLAQPIGRTPLMAGQALALGMTLCAAFGVGLGVPVVWLGVRGMEDVQLLAVFLGGGMLLHLSFLAIAFLLAIMIEEPLRGFAAALFLWLSMAFLYDGLVLLLLTVLADYPLDRFVIGAVLLNPIDLERILVLMHLDASVMLGYTGAVFKRFFGTSQGLVIAFGTMTLWVILPSLAFMSRLKRKDF